MIVYIIIPAVGLLIMVILAMRLSHPIWGGVLLFLTGVLISAVLRAFGIFP